jgi:predicted transcriptional regulator
MTIRDIVSVLEAETLTEGNLDREISLVVGCDLMSDVLTYSRSRSLLLTGLAQPQAVRTAEMAEISCVCFVRGKRPNQEALDLARKSEIPLMSTPLSMYEACGKLYQTGLSGCKGQR